MGWLATRSFLEVKFPPGDLSCFIPNEALGPRSGCSVWPQAHACAPQPTWCLCLTKGNLHQTPLTSTIALSGKNVSAWPSWPCPGLLVATCPHSEVESKKVWCRPSSLQPLTHCARYVYLEVSQGSKPTCSVLMSSCQTQEDPMAGGDGIGEVGSSRLLQLARWIMHTKGRDSMQTDSWVWGGLLGANWGGRESNRGS